VETQAQALLARGLTLSGARVITLPMPKEQEYTGASFELARPEPDTEENLRKARLGSAKQKPVQTGGEFETSRPEGGQKSKTKGGVVAKTLPGAAGSAKPEMTPAQRFFLARPGEGAVSAKHDTPRKGGREV
jgi:hypothetical protein